jgi:predicted nucleotidyltransferase component of viral defense system
MSVTIIQDRLNGYNCRSSLEEEQALREITQEILLAAMGRTDFFQKSGFQGGTCLRIFHGLNRFSEDLDFALQEPDSSFKLQPYLDTAKKELTAYGFELQMDDRSKVGQTVRKAFVKDDSLGKLLQLNFRPMSGPMRKMRIKVEVDTNPPEGATFETNYMDFPFLSAICVFDLSSLYAGKLHALLCREYLKGRDWYDFVWYTARRTPANYALLSSALNQTGPWKGKNVKADRAWCLEQLQDRIKAIDWKQAREDVRRFVKSNEQPSLELWNAEFFQAQATKLA